MPLGHALRRASGLAHGRGVTRPGLRRTRGRARRTRDPRHPAATTIGRRRRDRARAGASTTGRQRQEGASGEPWFPRRLLNFDEAAVAALAEGDGAFARGEDRVVLADPGARARPELRAALADEDHPGLHALAGEHLHAEHLRVRVATVARGTETLLMGH